MKKNTANVNRVAFGVTENTLKLYCSDGRTSLNILKTTELIYGV